MASVDKVKISDTTYDVSPSSTGTLNGYTSGDSTSPSNWFGVDVISTSDTNSSIFNKITTMVQNVRWLYTKLGSDDFSDTGSDTITGALSTLQSGLDGKSPVSHTHTVDTLPVSSNQVNSENYVPTSVLLYSMIQRANTVADNVTAVNDHFGMIGTTWLYEQDGTFTVPATGTYKVEMHGGGGGALTMYRANGSDTSDITTDPACMPQEYASGGGSGEIYTLELMKGQEIPVVIGAGGAASNNQYCGKDEDIGSNGGASYFGDLSIAGGGGATKDIGGNEEVVYAGTASGSLASDGMTCPMPAVWYRGSVDSGNNVPISGGEGNTGNTGQTYGDGGNVYATDISCHAYDGKNGAVIITFMQYS